MRINNRVWQVVCVLAVLLVQCKKDTLDTSLNENMGYDYYPIERGGFMIYSVTHITIDAPVGRFDTARFHIKEIITDSVKSSSTNETSYTMERYTRARHDSTWKIKDVWTIRKSNEDLVTVEENIPVVSLVFPLSKNFRWNANRYNTLDDEDYHVIEYDRPDTVNRIALSNVATVEGDNSETLIEKRYNVKKYARGYGLVYKQNIRVESQTSKTIPIDITKPIMTRVTRGTIETWELESSNRKITRLP